ncbi:MAG: hypothetical protein IKP32_08865, partial [Clostridia bacterium]|nr:hypothetical protein [Clostridia bacterium]
MGVIFVLAAHDSGQRGAAAPPFVLLGQNKESIPNLLRFKIQIGKDEKRAKGRRGILFSPKEKQKGRYNGGDH